MQKQEKIKFRVNTKDDTYLYLDERDLFITGVGHIEPRFWKRIWLSSRLVVREGSDLWVYADRLNQIAVKFSNAIMFNTDKGTLILKHMPGSSVIMVEIPSGYRGYNDIDYPFHKENDSFRGCIRTGLERSPAGALGSVSHIWCNVAPNDKYVIKYKIGGRTYTSGYGSLPDIFGEELKGRIVITDNSIKIIPAGLDDVLDDVKAKDQDV